MISDINESISLLITKWRILLQVTICVYIYTGICNQHTGCPNWTQFSNARIKSGSDSLRTCRLLSFSMFLIHLFAWPWGSINRGHRVVLLKRSRSCYLYTWVCATSRLVYFTSRTPLTRPHPPDNDTIVNTERVRRQPVECPVPDSQRISEYLR